MATKQTSSPGNSYFINAAKQFVWPIDLKEKAVLVPQDELTLAEQHLTVRHLRSLGWHIQSVIPGSIVKSVVFNPEIRLKEAPVKAPEQESAYTVGDRFVVKSTSCELKIKHTEGKKIHLSYTNRVRHDLIVSEDQLNRNLDFKSWYKL